MELPNLHTAPAPPPPPTPATRAPSDLGGAKALPGKGDTEEIALARGTATHLLLEDLACLPMSQRDNTAQHLLQDLIENPDTAPAAAFLPGILEEVLNVLGAPGLARFFGPGSLAEVPISADLGHLGRVHGIIDRLIVTDDTVTAVDFKTNRATPERAEDTPEGLLRQMGAYHAALSQLYPDRSVEVGLIWTAKAHYMSLPHGIVTQALARAAAS